MVEQEGGSTVQGRALRLVETLCKALDAEGVRYCHWKSTAALDRAASGETDLDLLVLRSDVSRFTEILNRLGFKEAVIGASRRLPGVCHYFGYDEDADRFVHVHAHYQLVLGDDMTKNYRVPIEFAFIESASQQGPFKIPSPEFEFVVFVIRMILKHRTWDTLLRGHGRLRPSARREFEHLQSNIDPVEVDRIVDRYVPSITTPLFRRCVASLRATRISLRSVRVGYELQRALKGHSRRQELLNVHVKQWRWMRRAFGCLITRRPARARLAAGGALIAIVGGDGAGKSTAVTATQEWLSRHFESTKVHLGKPPKSIITLAVLMVLKIRERWVSPGRRAAPPIPAANAASFPGYIWLLGWLAVARDRYRTYAKARRCATNGDLVISDRYPIPGLMLMDGPQCLQAVGVRRRGHFSELLARREEAYYKRIMPPDLLIVLRAHPETAVQRKPGEDPSTVRARNTEVWAFPWERTRAHVIDASRNTSEVIARLKSLIWASL